MVAAQQVSTITSGVRKRICAHLRALIGSHRANLILAKTEEAHDLLDVRTLTLIWAVKVARRRALDDGHQPANALSRLLIPINCLHAPSRQKKRTRSTTIGDRRLRTDPMPTLLENALAEPPNQNPARRCEMCADCVPTRLGNSREVHECTQLSQVESIALRFFF